MSRNGTNRAATVSKQLRRAGFIVGRTGVNEHEADVMVRASNDKVRVACWIQPDTVPERVAEQTQEIITVLVNKGYDVTINDCTDDPDAPCTFLHLDRPKWNGKEEVANRLGDIDGRGGTPSPEPEPEVQSISRGIGPICRKAVDQPRELSVPARAEVAIEQRNRTAAVEVTPERQREIVRDAIGAARQPDQPGGARLAASADRDANLMRTAAGMVYDQVVWDPDVARKVTNTAGLNRCQCGGSNCLATTKRTFAPGHDAAMVSRWAARVYEGVANTWDAERNILAAGGSQAMVDKLHRQVARKRSGADQTPDHTIRVRVQHTITLTTEQVAYLSTEYGCGTGDADIREFVKDYIDNLIKQCPAGEFWDVQ